MFEATCKFESAFERMEEDDINFKYHYLDYDIGGDEMTGISPGITSTLPTKQDRDNCRVLVKFLKLFYNATKRFSGSLYVTSNYFFDDIVVIENKIQQLINRKEDLFLSSMAKKMKEEFDKYWGGVDKINLLVYIAVVLDPRKKLKYLKFCLSQFLEETIVNEMTSKVNNCLIRLYEFYASQDSVTVEVPSASEASKLEVDDDCDDPHALIAFQFSSYMEEEYSSVCKNEVEKYLGGTTVKVQRMSCLIYWLGGKLILQSIQRCPN
ncbi:Zinc finger BED domain-containing protein [Actinidia chinensis var. chinensis]|uniref:Zinc finger BED domain-containing protein n=1 Tax=Actinidia chinensis var. chinensis TaxID=1590841 RepID=A0A2R6QKA7_ACTCC|nr:Zinc finger BED domain-containing protein [Actinidia chinensis var. chinensis]